MGLKEFFNHILSQPAPTENKPKKRVSRGLKRNYTYRVELTLEELKNAVDSANNPENPDRKLLYTIYNQAVKDSHVASQIRTAEQGVIQSRGYLTKNGEADKKATELLQTAWFDNWIKLALSAEWWGHALIEFGQLNDEGRFEQVSLIPRLNVRQEYGLVVPEYTDTKGIDYRKNATRLALMEIGNPYDLGLMELASKEVIVKNYARTDWSQSSEKYGMPLLKILTDTSDEDELDKMEAQAADFATNGYIILHSDDESEIVQPKNSDFYKIYQENIQLCDAQISKLINGQTGTSDEKAFVGSAEVHERILNDYTRARLRNVSHLINRELIPFLSWWSYPLEGYYWQFEDLLPKKKEEKKEQEDPEGEKKKLTLPAWAIDMPPATHSH